MYAAQAIDMHSSSWHHASATRGRATRLPSAEPTLLPMPRPVRKTARINENVYVVAPKSSESVRVQRTSAASAVMPDMAMTRYTGQRPRASADGGATASVPTYGALDDTRYAVIATAALIVTAT